MKYTHEQLVFLAENTKLMSRAELTIAFNRAFNCNQTAQKIKAALGNHHISSGRTGHFLKGNKPWNTNTRGLLHVNKTSFKPGNRPANLRPIGSERICSKDGFILIKVACDNPYTKAKTRFCHKHVVIWEQEYGKVPQGKVIKFIDGNKLNCTLDNLVCVSRSELLYLNQRKYNEYPAEVKPSILAVAKLATTINKIRKEK